MALKVPTTTRVCLNCKINSDANAGMEFHEIFDEVGLELQLPFLVKTFFCIDLRNKDKQHLCDDCVNRLIELYDLDELAKEESCKINNLKNMPECSYNEESSKHLQNESGNFRYERENSHKPFIHQINTQANITKSNSLEHTNVKTFDLPQGDARNGLEINKHKSEDKDCTDVGHFNNKNRSAPFAQQQNQRSDDIPEDFPNEDFDQTGERKVLQDLNISLSASLIKDEKSIELESDELESDEHMEFISDDENQDVEINKKSNANIIVNVRKEVDEAEQANTSKKTHNENEGQKSFYVEEVEDRSNQILSSNDSNSLLEELETIEENEAFLLNTSSSATEFNNREHIDADDFIEQEDISDDTCSLEEDNLIEKIILTEEYDQVDLNEYLDKVLITKFQDLVLNWETECKLCLEKYNSFGKLLKHACMVGFKKKLSCIIKDCEEDAKDLPTLARHLILTHYDKLESTTIYSKCTDCRKTFSNVLDFNKHSCCRNIKQKIRSPKYCKYCDLDFQSSKRYAFHMQFHLKNHRPKICLLCSNIFNNSNDFFEHTHYTHNPKSTLTCERCDRFFKDIKVFNKHMKVHDVSKYQHKCAHCPKKYTSQTALNRHMDDNHNNNSKAFQCEYCTKKLRTKTLYRNHLKSHATDAKVKTFICSTCGLITKNMEMIKEHIESDKESPCFSSQVEKKILGLGYSCESCSLDFCTIKHLKDHRLSDSHRDDLFYCGMCRKSFTNLSQMRFHSFNDNKCKEWQKSFPITRHFVCNIGDCQEFYISWFALFYHKKNHHKTEEKLKTNSPTEFKCQFCQQLCSSKKLLAIHVAKIHDNAKLKCSHCEAKFPSKYILQKHIDKKHTPVECDSCLKIFKHRRNYERHIDIVHNNVKRYFCKHCQKGFYYQAESNMHEKRRHPQL